MNAIRLAAGGLLLVSLAGCELLGPGRSAGIDGLEGPTWKLVLLETAAGDSVRIPEDITTPDYDGEGYTLVFGSGDVRTCIPRGTGKPSGARCVSGRGHPNFFSGGYTAGPGDHLAIYLHTWTEIATPAGSVEDAYFDALEGTQRYQVDGSRLILYHHEGRVLQFEAAGQGE